MAARIRRNSEQGTGSPGDTTSSHDYISPPVAQKRTPARTRCTKIIPNSFNSPALVETSRRAALAQFCSLSIVSSSLLDTASASEIDTTGQLFTSKNEMIKGGGSDAARGISLNPVEKKVSRSKKNDSLLKSSGLIQDVYTARFVTYLARFLLVYDPAASAWWKKNSKPIVDTFGLDDESNQSAYSNNDISRANFAEFAESVEVGLADYFVGPYGSYASVDAAKAGITATEQVKSVREPGEDISLWDTIFANGLSSLRKKQSTSSMAKRKSKNSEKESLNRQGILNLYSLLKARYTSIEEKQQLVLLFTFIELPLQPVQEIRGLLGEIDDGSIAGIDLVDLSKDYDVDENEALARDYFRLSSRQGGGYSKNDRDIIRVEPPAPLGAEYKPAKLKSVMRSTTRILRINVIDGGQGYNLAPAVIVTQRGVSRQCEATATIDRKGSISEIIVLDPGFGYGRRKDRLGEPILPTIEIRERILRNKNSTKEVIPAMAVPELEYEIVGVDIIDGGSGYIFDQPPEVSVNLPRVDPDWFAAAVSQNTQEDEENELILATVTQMTSGTNNGGSVDMRAFRREINDFLVGDRTIRRIQKDPIRLLPSNTRPRFSKFINDASDDVIETGSYSITSIPPAMTDRFFPIANYRLIRKLPSNFRAIDPIFGGLGKAPVTKNAVTLSTSQYSRLALAGALCTVLVRTALNPLELVKTKIQLGNDPILDLAMKRAASSGTDPQPSSASTSEVDQTLDLAMSKDASSGTDPEPSSASTSEVDPIFDSAMRKAASNGTNPRPLLVQSSSTSEFDPIIDLATRKAASNGTDPQSSSASKPEVGTVQIIQTLVEVRGPLSLFQSADITFITSVVFGLFGFGATELFRRSFSAIFYDETATGTNEFLFLAAAGLATLLTCAAGAPFEILRVRSMSTTENQSVKKVFGEFVEQNRLKSMPAAPASSLTGPPTLELQLEDIKPLWSSFNPIVSRELPFAVTKFLVFDLSAGRIADLVNSSKMLAEPLVVGVGPLGLLLSAFAGALAGIAGAFVSHPADLILTLTSASSQEEGQGKDWKMIVKELVDGKGGILNLFAGFPARSVFFFLVIGLQFFLYDYIKSELGVGTEDLTLVLDVFYAVRQGLLE